MRLRLVLTLFQHAIDLDSSHYGGYAGAAQVSALLSALMPEGAGRDAMLANAQDYAEKAVQLRPDSSWVQSSAAWVAFANSDYSTAKRLSANAIELDPNDLHTREIDSLISLFTADFQRAAIMSNPAQYQGDTTGRITNRNVYAIANFYLGNHRDTVRQMETVIEQGEPISEISVFYLIAALWKDGARDAAQDYVSYYHKAWPDSRVDLLLARTFISDELLTEPTALFREAGGFLP